MARAESGALTVEAPPKMDAPVSACEGGVHHDEGGWAGRTCAGGGLWSRGWGAVFPIQGPVAVILEDGGIHAWLGGCLVAWLFEMPTGEEDR